MSNQFAPAEKFPGDLIKSEEWNEAMTEIERLEDDKANRSGPETITGPLTVEGNVGIGTTSQNAELHVNGDIRLGASHELFALRAGETLRVIAGRVEQGGHSISGVGYHPEKLETGKYRITFEPPFTSLPAVVASPYQYDRTLVSVYNINMDHCQVLTFDPRSNQKEDRHFSFIALGAS